MPHWHWPWHAEIEKFPAAVLASRHPESTNLGDVSAHDFTDRAAAIARPDVLVFGSPCQSFSVAGKRLGLDDPRGNLALVALGLVGRLRPRWFVFENVPGLLSSDGGRDFGAFLGLVGELGYGWTYRILDAQYFGVAQRRRRVFVVGHLGDWRRSAAVLFEPEGMRGDSAPRRQAGQNPAPTIASRPTGGGGLGTDFDCDGGLVAHSLRAEGFDASEDGTGRGTPIVPYTLAVRGRNGGHDLEYRQDGTANAILTPNGGRAGIGVGAIAFSAKDYGADAQTDLSPTLRAGGHTTSHANAGVMPAIAFDLAQITSKANRTNAADGLPASTIAKDSRMHVASSAVRRLTPRECERLQGFPDDYTLIDYRNKPAADGPRYKALGNSMAVPVMRWILSRVEAVEAQR
jgi:DNA (cytosine-5)-methyltransferase 1